jgi:ribonuclease III, bacterial
VYQEIEKVLNYTFKNKDILREALTHRSYNPHPHGINNERLEFLGDSVLGLVVAGQLYNLLTTKEEGVLSKIKANLVSRKNLYFWAKQLNIGKYLFLGQGEISSGGRERASILSNAMEALLGAIYLDGGFEEVSKVILAWFKTQKIEVDLQDYKSVLQEYMQKLARSVPDYEIIETIGPEHDKIFTAVVYEQGKELGRGRGHNKKAAHQAAAKDALDKIHKKNK